MPRCEYRLGLDDVRFRLKFKVMEVIELFSGHLKPNGMLFPKSALQTKIIRYRNTEELLGLRENEIIVTMKELLT